MGEHSREVAQRAIDELQKIRDRQQVKEPGKLLYTLLRDNGQTWLEEVKSKAVAKANAQRAAAQAEHDRLEGETLAQIAWQNASAFYASLSVADRKELVECWFDTIMPTMKGRQMPKMLKLCEAREMDRALMPVFTRK